MLKNRKLEVDKIKRVVVRGTNWVGDAVMTVPALRELRRVLPHAHITLCTRPWSEGLFEDADFVDDLLLYDRSKGLRSVARQIKEWRSRKFDLAVLFQNAFEAAALAAGARVPARLGYATDGRRALLTHPLAPPGWRSTRHEVFYYLNLAGELEQLLYGTSDAMQREPQFDLKVSAARQDEAREMLHDAGARLNRPLVALCPGSTNSLAKRWPAGSYAELADKLAGEMRANVILIGSPDEVDVSREVASLMRFEPVILTGRTNLAQAVAVLSLTNVLISNDTGPAHIAAALNRPTLVIFGPTDPTTTRPFSPVAEVIRKPPDCAPCMLRVCPIDHRCMTAITPDEIYSRAQALLQQRHQVGVEA